MIRKGLGLVGGESKGQYRQRGRRVTPQYGSTLRSSSRRGHFISPLLPGKTMPTFPNRRVFSELILNLYFVHLCVLLSAW